MESNVAQPDIIRHVSESTFTQVAQNVNLGSLGGLDDGNQVNPAVVIHINSGNAPPAFRFQRQRNTLELLPVDVFPQSDSGSTCVRYRNIHPSIFIEIKNNNAGSGR